MKKGAHTRCKELEVTLDQLNSAKNSKGRPVNEKEIGKVLWELTESRPQGGLVEIWYFTQPGGLGEISRGTIGGGAMYNGMFAWEG